MISRYAKRRVTNHLALGFCILATLLGLALLGDILYTLIGRGVAGLSWEFFSQSTPGPGGSGGMLNAIVGSVMVTTVGIIIAIPLGVLAGTWLAEYGGRHFTASLIRFVNGMLLSSPSILIGLFIYGLLVVPFGHFSGWAGSIALAVIALPVIVNTTEEMLKLVPQGLREAAAGLGAPKWKVTWDICIRSAKPGITTGILLSLARITGETAPLLFTSLNNQFFSTDMSQPIANLPVTIYRFALSPYESWNQLAWTGALVITVTILTINTLSRWILKRKEIK